MEKFIAFCGLNCEECEAYIATKNNDIEKKKKLAEDWSKAYKTTILPEDINCDGCTFEGKHIGYCNMCNIRKCASSKNVKNCALCNEYPECNTLNDFLKMIPEEGSSKIKSNLEKIKAGL